MCVLSRSAVLCGILDAKHTCCSAQTCRTPGSLVEAGPGSFYKRTILEFRFETWQRLCSCRCPISTHKPQQGVKQVHFNQKVVQVWTHSNDYFVFFSWLSASPPAYLTDNHCIRGRRKSFSDQPSCTMQRARTESVDNLKWTSIILKVWTLISTG